MLRMLSHITVFLLLSVGLINVSLAKSETTPDALYQGMIQFELNSGRYFDALVLMDQDYIQSHPVDYLTALQGFNIHDGLAKKIESAKQLKNLTDEDYYKLGRLDYHQGECLPALKTFKKIQNTVSLKEKDAWSFYRANCFIRLGSNVRAGQALNDVVGGIWAAYAYYNLGIAYAETSRDSTRALGALGIAESLNKGGTREANSLNDRINLAAGKLLLDAKKYDSASQFFRKIYLNSESTAAGLYLHGLALLESGDFRAATQTWHSIKTYPVIEQSVAEAYLAIPYAFERSGYTSQTIEAYLDASTTFEAELEKITKIDAALAKHGAAKTFIEDNEIAGLEWFLKDVAKNTTRAMYYQYLMKHEPSYDMARLYAELKMLSQSLEFWETQLTVFSQSLSKKKQSYSKEKSAFNPSAIRAAIQQQESNLVQLTKKPGMTPTLAGNLQLDVLKNSIEVLNHRLASMQERIQKGESRLGAQLDQSKSLDQSINQAKARLNKLITALDKELTEALRKQLAKLKTTMLSNYERSEQGRIHLFEDMAESKQIKKNNLNGRYQ